MNESNYKVLVNVVACVESGGQIYGNRRYDAYAPAYANTANEHTCTLGYGQFYGDEAQELIQMIFNKATAQFRSIDNGSIEAMLSKNWVSSKWNPNSTQKSILIKLITTDIGKQCQDELFIKRLKLYVARAEKFGVKSIKAQMMWAEIQHLGGVKPVERIFKRCNNNYSLDNIMTALKKDQEDSSSSNQVGDKIFWTRHTKCREYIDKYAIEENNTSTTTKVEVKKEDTKMGYDIQKLINIAVAEVGYLEKASNANLDSKTANAGKNNYTKYWRDMNPAYQAQAWCDCFVDWCFVQAYGKTAAQQLECGGCGEFYTPTSAQCYKNKGQWHTSNPKIGDQIFFKNSERICHTGIVYAVNSSTVYTIEGNTSGASGVVANGGGVCKKSYSLANSRIAGYGRPNYGTTAIAVSTTTSTTQKTKGEIMIKVESVKNGSKGSSVYLLQTILKGRGIKGGNGQPLTLDGDCGANTVAAINSYQAARRNQGVELGTNGKNDGCCGSKMWNDLTGGLVV